MRRLCLATSLQSNCTLSAAGHHVCCNVAVNLPQLGSCVPAPACAVTLSGTMFANPIVQVGWANSSLRRLHELPAKNGRCACLSYLHFNALQRAGLYLHFNALRRAGLRAGCCRESPT